jgi:hypothetical protein
MRGAPPLGDTLPVPTPFLIFGDGGIPLRVAGQQYILPVGYHLHAPCIWVVLLMSCILTILRKGALA